MTNRARRALAALSTAVLCAALGGRAAGAQDEVEFPPPHPGLLSLDLYAPRDAVDRPIMIHVHGGGWRRGDKSRCAAIAAAFVREGFVFLSMNYRLLPEAGVQTQAGDVARAVAWTRGNAAELGGDPDRIFLMGHSAGAHLVALVGTDGRYLEDRDLSLDAVRGVVVLDTQVFDIAALARPDSGTLPAVYRSAFGDDPQTWAQMSPAAHVARGRGIPPFAVAYSGGMRLWPNPRRGRHAEAFVEKLSEAGVRAQLIRAPEKTHMQIARNFGAIDDPVCTKVMAFLHDVLQDEPRRGAARGQDARQGASTLKDRFDQLDRNGYGVLTVGQAGGLVRFDEGDSDRDGSITLDEVRAWRRKQREAAQRPGAMDGELPKGAANAESLFRLAYIHQGSLAQASALIDVFENGHPDILIACKRQVHLVRNRGEGAFDHAATLFADNANGWGAHDFNADGRLDAFVAQQQRRQADCWINNGHGAFIRRDLGNETVGCTRNVLFADFDGDGHIDSYHSVSAFGTNHAGCELHPGKADGTFGPDIIRQVLEPDMPGFWYATATHPDRGQEEWANKMFKGAVVRDFDGDGKPDIATAAYADLGYQEGGRGGFGQQWVEHQDRGLFVLHNRSTPGHIHFTEVARQAIGEYAHGNTRKHWNCYSVVPLDYDGDGDPDLFVGAVTRRHGGEPEDTRCVALYENASKPGEIRFVDRTRESGFGRYNELPQAQRWQISFASGAALDYDNDGWVDLCLINRRDKDRTRWPYPHLFRSTGKGTFVEVPAAEHAIGGEAGGRDLDYGDLDGDGRLDVIIHDGTVGGYDGQDNTRIYMNQVVNENHWVRLNVVRGLHATPAIGARVVIYKAGTQTILGSDEVRTDFCYRSKRSCMLHFGLGQVDHVDVRVTLPGGELQTLRGLPAGQVHTLSLGLPEGRDRQSEHQEEARPLAGPGLGKAW